MIQSAGLILRRRGNTRYGHMLLLAEGKMSLMSGNKVVVVDETKIIIKIQDGWFLLTRNP